jgi:mannose-6-phosphate isomerase-like protein (cupin superfamily)
MELVLRYTYRRLTKLPSTVDELRRHTVLNLPGMLQGLRFEHTVMGPGATVPISVEDDTGVLMFTLSGRGVMVLDGDRIEVGANDLVHIPAGVPYGMHTLGGTDWVYVVLQAPVS